LVVVADGAGGHRGGALASQKVVEVVPSYYLAFCQQGLHPQQALAEAVRWANNAVRELQQIHPDKQEMASTVVALALRDNQLWIVNVGDSRAYAYRPGTVLQQMSVDHTLVQEQVRLGNLTPDQARLHPFRHQLLQALGSHEAIQLAEVHPDTVLPGDRYILCTDGLTDELSDAHLQAALAERWPLGQVADHLMRQALSSAKDNVSLALLEFPAVAQEAVTATISEEAASEQAVSGLDGGSGGHFWMWAPLLVVSLVAFMIFGRLIAPPLGEARTEVALAAGTIPEEQTGEAMATGILREVPLTAQALEASSPEPVTTNSPESLPPIDPSLQGAAATASPSPLPVVEVPITEATPTPLPRIVEYSAGWDSAGRPNTGFVVFESTMGYGANPGNQCHNLTIVSRTMYPGIDTILTARPHVEQRGNDIYVAFEADSSQARGCGEIRADERVTLHTDIPEYPLGVWVIRGAIGEGPIIPADPGGWVIPVRWIP
jgi:protein phosphatase